MYTCYECNVFGAIYMAHTLVAPVSPMSAKDEESR